jgi:hypothetical protein
MKGLLFLALVGAAIYGAIVLSYNLLPHHQQRMSSLGKASVIRTTVSCVLGARTFRL